MDSSRATAIFALCFAMRGTIDVIGDRSAGTIAWLAMGAVTVVATVAYWFGARRRTHRWIHSALSGFVAMFLLLSISRMLLSLPLSRWPFLFMVLLLSIGLPLILARVFATRIPASPVPDSP